MQKDLETWFSDNKAKLESLSLEIWKKPEASREEHFASELIKKELTDAGFVISKPEAAGLETAFEAKWGSGSPHIGFLAEYDALPGLSQEICSSKCDISGQKFGHGCGHNLLGVGALGAALSLKEAMMKNGLKGTVYLYGCPSEEIMEGKILMAKAHVFDHLDTAVTWHPGDHNRASEESYQAMMSVRYEFHGKASHAAMSPQNGRSALDAVELMNVGVNYLREHVPPGGQMHYVILNGGDKPNIVPEKASVWYFIRANSTSDLRNISGRIEKIAEGAALMTGTSHESKVLTGCNETRIVPELVRLMDCVMEEEVPPIVWSDEEILFSKQLLESLDVDKEALRAEFGNEVFESPLDNAHTKISGRTVNILGSSDVSDVSYIAPTVMLFAACYPKGTPNHTWGVTACAGHSIGRKGMLYAAKVMSSLAYKLFENPEELGKVKKSFREALNGEEYRPIG